MAIEFDIINKKKRKTKNFIFLVNLVFLLVAFLLFYTGRFSDNTIFERILNVDKRYRKLGLILFLLFNGFVFFIPKLFKLKHGKIFFDYDKIDVIQGSLRETYLIGEISKLTILKDLQNQEASEIIIETDEKMHHYEFSLKTREQYNEIIPLLKYWEDKIDKFYSYPKG